ncbi:MAG: hypothetical protein ACOYO1_19515 [Bacteroidales bacterium]
MEWNEKLKQFIQIMGIKREEITTLTGMSRTGFNQGLEAGTLKFDIVIQICLKYNINLYELIEKESDINRKQFWEKFTKEDIGIENLKFMSDKLQLSYETRLAQNSDYIDILKSNLDRCILELEQAKAENKQLHTEIDTLEKNTKNLRQN